MSYLLGKCKIKAYHEMLEHVLSSGKERTDRTGTGTISTFGMRQAFDLNECFPLVTTKALHLKSIIHELLWFISGNTNVRYLQKHGVRIWDEWADENGDLGPVYGKQWRDFSGVDQLEEAIKAIRNTPDSRRIIVSAWNPRDIGDMALPPCHVLYQFYVDEGKLSCQLYQRSADMFLGVPYNIASYALLTHMIAAITGLGVGEFIWVGGDCHIYKNHLSQVHEQLSRPFPACRPTVHVDAHNGAIIDSICYNDITVSDYTPLPSIKAAVSV